MRTHRNRLTAGLLFLLLAVPAPGAPGPQKVRTPYLPGLGQVPVEELERPAAAFPETFVLQGPETEPRVALTFDDGPSPFTPALLDLLREKKVRATFFVLGSAAQKHPEVLKRTLAEGHTVGNHTWNHPNLTKLTGALAWKDEIGRTQDFLLSVLGQAPRLFRPPYGFLPDAQVRDLGGRGMTVAAWSVASDDWYLTSRLPEGQAAEAIADQVAAYVHPGAIVLLHDAGGKTRRPTVEAVGLLIDRLRARGYRLVTVDELLGVSPFLPARP